VRIAFLGSPPFATPILARLIDSPHRPVVVVTQPDRPRGRGREVVPGDVARLALDAGLPLLQPESARDPAFVAALRAHAPEALLVAAYGEILREELLALAPRGAFNVHASLLPRWRGASPIQQAILHGDARTGVTIQRMVRALDAGDVLLARATEIGPDESAGELAARLALLGGEAAVDALDRIEAETAHFVPQDQAAVTLCRKLDKDAGRIEWGRDAAYLARFVRAMHPWPGARCGLDGGGKRTEVGIRRARVVAAAPAAAAPGALLERDTRLVVACGGGAVELLELQNAGRQALEVGAWLRGVHLSANARFVELPPAGA
jgi:methionyl-tRNA formyltransferase